MKYDATAAFHADYSRLSPRERRLFLDAVRAINRAYAQRGGTWPPHWPAQLRIRAIRPVSGVWEMTWSFAGPDGRATFEFITVDGEPAIKWRRIGDDRILQQP